MHKLKFSIKTLSPIVLTSTSNSTVMTETHKAFGGSVIRGILASRFVESQNISDEAHNETFREIFYGGLKFLSANPEVKGERSFVLPMSLQKGKAGTSSENSVKDLLIEKEPPRGYKTFRGFGVLDKEEFYTAQIKTNIFMHMSRSGDKERLAGKSEDSGIYNYESIDAEQTFCGEILGEEKLLRKMLDGLNLKSGEMFAYVGRSRFTQYGKCLVTFGGIKKIPYSLIPNPCYLCLETPLIPFDDCFIGAKKILEAEVARKLGENFSIGKVFASSVEIENFVATWLMKRPRVTALAAGSVFELIIPADKEISDEKLFEGFGTRTEEGFGQLRLWTPKENFTVDKLDEEDFPPTKIKLSPETIDLAKKILRSRLAEQVRIYAYKDADKLGSQLKRRGNMTHFFSRLDAMLSNLPEKNLRTKFAQQLAQEVRPGSQFEEHLENLYMANRKKFSAVLLKGAPLPHELNDLWKEKSLDKARTVIDFKREDFSDDDFYREYLKNYFRFARKIAADSKGGEAHE